MMIKLLRETPRLLNIFCMFLVACTASAAMVYSFLCAVDVFPWLQLSATFGETTFHSAGQLAQIALTIALVMLASFLPSSARVAALESGHRKFHLKMEDVAQAYYHCHAADRSGVFGLSSEFDAVRERLSYLRDHPDLGNLEPDVLEIAAQMSQQAKHLASIYSDENVGRAKTFLRQRQQEIEKQKSRIASAIHECQEIEKWSENVDMEESVVRSQLNQLEERLNAALPELGMHVVSNRANIYPLEPLVAGE